jgi:hypothetical protein
MRALTITSILSCIVVLVAACDGEGADSLGRNRRNGAVGNSADGDNDPTQPGNCKEGVAHPGFANVDFVADRKVGGLGVDRRRVKPYSALSVEFTRALGAVPARLSASESTYGQVPARWFNEPAAGAVSLYTTYSLAFTACYDSMSGATYAAAPTAETAGTECAKLQRKVWQRTATPEETQVCADFAVGLTSEPDARRRWAHMCASVMTSTGFTTY